MKIVQKTARSIGFSIKFIMSASKFMSFACVICSHTLGRSHADKQPCIKLHNATYRCAKGLGVRGMTVIIKWCPYICEEVAHLPPRCTNVRAHLPPRCTNVRAHLPPWCTNVRAHLPPRCTNVRAHLPPRCTNVRACSWARAVVMSSICFEMFVMCAICLGEYMHVYWKKATCTCCVKLETLMHTLVRVMFIMLLRVRTCKCSIKLDMVIHTPLSVKLDMMLRTLHRVKFDILLRTLLRVKFDIMLLTILRVKLHIMLRLVLCEKFWYIAAHNTPYEVRYNAALTTPCKVAYNVAQTVPCKVANNAAHSTPCKVRYNAAHNTPCKIAYNAAHTCPLINQMPGEVLRSVLPHAILKCCAASCRTLYWSVAQRPVTRYIEVLRSVLPHAILMSSTFFRRFMPS